MHIANLKYKSNWSSYKIIGILSSTPPGHGVGGRSQSDLPHHPPPKIYIWTKTTFPHRFLQFTAILHLFFMLLNIFTVAGAFEIMNSFHMYNLGGIYMWRQCTWSQFLSPLHRPSNLHDIATWYITSHPTETWYNYHATPRCDVIYHVTVGCDVIYHVRPHWDVIYHVTMIITGGDE